MADSRRQSKRTPRHKVEEEEDAHKRRDKVLLIVMGIASVLIVVGMIALSMFLSGR